MTYAPPPPDWSGQQQVAIAGHGSAAGFWIRFVAYMIDGAILSVAAASASPTAGCAASRRAHPTAPAAAPFVTRVCHRSHARAEPCPSSSQPTAGDERG